MKRKPLLKLTLSALFIAMGLLLPLLTGQIKEIGSMLLPMHLPILLCGLLCGWQYGLAVGFITPLLRSVTFGMPMLYPNAVSMAFELATYGAVIGLCYRLFKKKSIASIYASLIIAMISGRLVWGLAQTVLLGFGGKLFTLAAFWAGGFANAFPGILIQLVLIPAIMLLLKRLKITEKV